MNKQTALILVLVGLVLVPSLQAAVPGDDEHEHLGVQSCAASSCHGSAGVRDVYSVLQNEYITWARHDAHSGAYQVLLSEESKNIAANLGLESAHKADLCLDCHTDNVPAAQRGLQFQLSDGVSCEACHGGAEHWLGVHISGGGNKHAESLAAGLYPTEEPAARAELCLSCHLGTADRFATHRVMGAGHPRLSFDLARFTDLQPRHFRVDQDYRTRKAYVEETRTWAIGQVSAARRYMTLLQGPLLAHTGLFPEPALFNCHGCHRSMKYKQWQPNPRTGTPPGSVSLNDSALLMSAVIASVVKPESVNTLRQNIRALHQATQTDLDALRRAAGELDSDLATLANTLEQKPFGSETIAAMQSAMTDAIAQGQFVNYAEAEQATMAMDVFCCSNGASNPQLDALYATVADEDQFDPIAFAAVYARPGRTPPQRESAVLPSRADHAAQGKSVTTETATPRRVNATALRVRAAPTTGSAVIDSLDYGAVVSVIEESDDWVHIDYKRDNVARTGWVARRYLQ